MLISTSAAVLLSIFLIFSCPLSQALTIESIRLSAVVPKGTSVMEIVRWSICFMRALTLKRPPLRPSLYFETSIKPPVGKSGYMQNSSPLNMAMEASISSLKLCGRISQANPTAMPFAPCASKRGNLTGKVSGSIFLPSYDGWKVVVFGLNTTSNANSDRRASMYRGAAAPSPVRMFPQLPWQSINKSF